MRILTPHRVTPHRASGNSSAGPKRLLEGMDGLSEADRMVLHVASPHAFRHTFGTHAAADEVPIDIIQRALGHASMQTTSI